MSVSITAEINLNNLADIVQGMSPGKALFQIECCVWCMLETNKRNGEILRVLDNSLREFYSVVWDETALDMEKINNSIHDDEGIEYGAEAIALILAILKTEFDAVKRSKKGKGYDYRLVRRDSLLFQQSARLEISGILRGSNRRVTAREREKLDQVSQYVESTSACVIVIEFSGFLAKVIWANG
ncbi:MAG: hypothetical protein KJ069_25760 [Anaerolineae bacterium]|nr:hypothetical protein [Anaerolineae bacterium]